MDIELAPSFAGKENHGLACLDPPFLVGHGFVVVSRGIIIPVHFPQNLEGPTESLKPLSPREARCR